MFKINRRALLGLVASVLVAAAFTVVPTAASATVACRVLTYGTASQGVGAKTCNNPPGVTAPQNLRENGDGAGTNPVSTNFPTEELAVNNRGQLRYKFNVGGLGVAGSIPEGDVLFGLKLQGNPESSATVCRAATGTIPWVNIQRGSPSAVFDGSNAWTFSVESNSSACAEAGRVKIHNVSLLFETLTPFTSGPTVVTGTIVGVYEQPGETCRAGGIRLNIGQPGLTSEPSFNSWEFDNGSGQNVYICFVAANNYLYPSSAPTWALTQGTGIWKD